MSEKPPSGKTPAEIALQEQSRNEDERWMREALRLAEMARDCNEVPVGAVVVCQGEIVGRGFNQPLTQCDPAAHAEIIALRDAGRSLGNYRLTGCELFVTIEPCAMCAGAMVHARIARLVFGAPEAKSGVISNALPLLDGDHINHKVPVVGGVLADDCGGLLSDFFRERRRQKKRSGNDTESRGPQ